MKKSMIAIALILGMQGSEAAKLCRIKDANITFDQDAGTWSFTNANIIVSGIYRCVNNLPSTYSSYGNENILGAPNQGGNICMCKRLSPSVSMWFLGAVAAGNWISIGGCEAQCVDYCVRQTALILN